LTEIDKIFGIPGAGKTERLLTKIEKYMSEGTFLNDICYVTFSKAAAKDAIKRIKNKFDIEDNPLYFGTIHSICKQMLGWDFRGKDGMKLENSENRHDFLKKFGLNYPLISNSDEPENAFTENTSVSNDELKIFQIISYCHHRFIPLENWRESGLEFKDISPDDVTHIVKQWDDYKVEHDLVSFDDMLTKTLEEELYPATRILFVDEFQDLSPLLYKIIQTWIPYMKKVVVAGDDDQCIYVFLGASPNFLLDLKAKETILDYSYRVPDPILKKAKKLIGTVNNRQQKEFKENQRPGNFYYLSSPIFKDLLPHLPRTEKTVFFLFRTNNFAKMFVENYLIPRGIPFSEIRPKNTVFHVWTYRLYEIRNAMLKIRKNEKLERAEVKRLLQIFPSCSKGKLDGVVRYGKKTWFKKKCQQTNFSVQDISNMFFTRIPLWDDRIVLSEIKNDAQKKAYLRNMENSYSTYSPYKIKVGTIHSSKGLEANTVFLFNNHSKITEDEILDKGNDVVDAEKRLYYVGMTRAMETLVIVDDFFDNYSFRLEI